MECGIWNLELIGGAGDFDRSTAYGRECGSTSSTRAADLLPVRLDLLDWCGGSTAGAARLPPAFATLSIELWELRKLRRGERPVR